MGAVTAVGARTRAARRGRNMVPLPAQQEGLHGLIPTKKDQVAGGMFHFGCHNFPGGAFAQLSGYARQDVVSLEKEGYEKKS